MNYKHVCCDLDMIFERLPPHLECYKSNADGFIFYTICWENGISLFYQKDGPATVFEYRNKPYRNELHPNLREAIEHLTNILGVPFKFYTGEK